jgi:hypothetical protein
MGSLRAIPIAAMLFIAIVPYTAWSQFGGSYPVWHAHRVALFAGGIVMILALGLRKLGVQPAKATVALTLPILGFLSTVLNPVVLVVAAGIGLIGGLIDRRRAYENANLVFIVMAAILFYGAAKPILAFSTFEPNVVAVSPGTPPLAMAGDIELRQRPSIVHIVLDGYGSSQTLNDIYGHDTGAFFNQLEQRGFVVIEDAISPYSQTLPTMASVMSGGPIDVSNDSGHPTWLRSKLRYTIRNGPVPALLESEGYTFARTESGYHFVDFDDAQVVADNPRGLSLLDAHMLRDLGEFFAPVHNGQLRAALAPGTLQDLPQPFFYYQHLIAPHPPFTINADGSDRESASEAVSFADGLVAGIDTHRAAYVEGYREKARFIETALLRQIDALPAGPSIVVIHGDHGPGAFYFHEDAVRTCMSERLTTFVAMYSDDPEVTRALREAAHSGFSIVNIYRSIFAALSDTDIPMLEPQASFLPWSDPTAAEPVPASDLQRSCLP